MSPSPAVLVTGGTGFVGAALVRRLAEAGRDVHVLCRRTSPREHLADLGVVWFEADLLDPRSVGGAIEAFAEGARARGRSAHVVHSAALISYRRQDAELSRRVNVEGTRVVLDACIAAGVERVCHVSSVVAVGQAPDASTELDEEARFDGARLRSTYVTTKRAGEDFALSVLRELDVVVVNPGAVFGPAREPSNTTRFLASLARRRILVAPPGSLSPVGVDDVAAGIELALEHGRRGRRYLLTESSWTLFDLMACVARELGGRPPLLRLPGPVWRAVVALAAVADRARPAAHATPEALRLLGEHYRFDARRAREELGWCPRPFAEVLRDTLEWMRGIGLLADGPVPVPAS